MSNNVSTNVLPGKELKLSFGSQEVTLWADMSVGIGGGEWPAACMFCHVLSHNTGFYKGLFDGKRVLELGSGTWLAGIMVEKIGARASEIVITDLEQYTDHLERNVSMNDTTTCSVHALDWLDVEGFVKTYAPESTQCGSIKEKQHIPTLPANPTSSSTTCTFDVILALECVYREDLYQPLIDTILHLSTKQTLIFLGLTRLFARPVFFDLLHAHGIYYTRLPEHSLPANLRRDVNTSDCGLLMLYFAR